MSFLNEPSCYPPSPPAFFFVETRTHSRLTLNSQSSCSSLPSVGILLGHHLVFGGTNPQAPVMKLGLASNPGFPSFGEAQTHRSATSFRWDVTALRGDELRGGHRLAFQCLGKIIRQSGSGSEMFFPPS